MLSKLIHYIRYRIDFEKTKTKLKAKGFEVSHFAEIPFKHSKIANIEQTNKVVFKNENLFEAYRFNDVTRKTSGFPLFKSALVGNKEVKRFNGFMAEENYEYATMLLLAFTYDENSSVF